MILLAIRRGRMNAVHRLSLRSHLRIHEIFVGTGTADKNEFSTLSSREFAIERRILIVQTFYSPARTDQTNALLTIDLLHFVFDFYSLKARLVRIHF